MVRRQTLLDAVGRHHGTVAVPRALPLGSEEDVRARLPFVVAYGDREVRLVELAGEIVAHTTVCPHRGGPLAATAVEAGRVTCPWHGYRFDIVTGTNADGRACRLDPAPKVAIDPNTREVILLAG
ncbi:MAG: Rieske (2Fe-2S) protein [Deltaproteobacteria bacterium]|nr:Rieske (2Fe-2S) protein [Deltaproteobacteria bacterium]